MARKIDAYVDTAAFIAFVDRSDTHHALFRRLFADPPRILTSTLVITEAHGWFLRRYDGERARHFLAMIEMMTPLATHAVSLEEQKAGIDVIRRFADQKLTLADAVGLHLMTRLKIPLCWSTDRHLSLTGSPLVIHAL
jgi:predicted nucleic acid-binding protein